MKTMSKNESRESSVSVLLMTDADLTSKGEWYFVSP